MEASDSCFCNCFKLKDADGKLAGVDASDLLVANSGNDLPVRICWTLLRLSLWQPHYGIIFDTKLISVDFQVIDLSSVSPELAFMANDADLVVLEGMVSIHAPMHFNFFLFGGHSRWISGGLCCREEHLKLTYMHKWNVTRSRLEWCVLLVLSCYLYDNVN